MSMHMRHVGRRGEVEPGGVGLEEGRGVDRGSVSDGDGYRDGR